MRICSLTVLGFAVLTSVSLGGCSLGAMSSVAPSQLDEQVKSASRIQMDPELERQSSAMYHFLLGQLAVEQEDFPDAVSNFNAASDLIDTPEPLLHSSLAELYLREGDLRKALVQTDHALEAEPNEAKILLIKGGILEAMGEAAAAEQVYRKVIELDKSASEAAILLGSYYLRTDRTDEALSVLEGFADKEPMEELGLFYLGSALEKKGETHDAAEIFERIVRANPRNIESVGRLASILLKDGNIQAVKQLGKRLVAQDSGSAAGRVLISATEAENISAEDALKKVGVEDNDAQDLVRTRVRLAMVALEKRELTEVVRHFALILAKDPSNSDIRYSLASALTSSGRSKEAVSELLKIGSDSSLYVKSRGFAAVLMRQLGDLPGAEKALRDVLKLEPDNKHVLSLMVMVLKDEEKYREAKEIFEKILAKDPKDEKFLFNYGVLLHEMGKKAEAINVMEQLVAINPKHSDALNFIAYDLAERRVELDRAIQLIRRALEVRPDDGFYLDTEGWIFFQKGDYAEAERILDRAVTLSDGDAEVLEHHGDVLLKLGKRSEGRQAYRMALNKISGDKEKKENMESFERLQKKLRALGEKLE